MLKSRKKLGMFDALPSYVGGKRRLAPVIFGEINKVIPRNHWSDLTFVDGFMGGASIALSAKARGFGKVIGTDLALRSVTIGQALIANNRVKVTKEDVVRMLAPREGPPGRVESDMVPAVFTRGQARAIDNALAIAAATLDTAKSALFRLLAIRMAMLAHAYGQVRPGTIHRLDTGEYEDITPSAAAHYIDGMRLPTVKNLWRLARLINGGIFQGSGEVHQTDIIEVLPSIQADIAYLDPPYANVCSYEREYRVLDQILEGLNRPTSPFTRRDGADRIDQLLERAQHIPLVVLSFGNAACTLEELEQKMTRLGRRTRAIALKYLHLPAVATPQKKIENREFLVIGVDPKSPLLQLHQAVGHSLDEVAQRAVQVDADLPRTQGTSALPLLGEDGEKGKPDVAQQLPALRVCDPLAEGDLRVDDPHLGLVEGAVHGDGELR